MNQHRSDDQAESSRRLEEYRLRHEREPEHHELDDYKELDTLPKCHALFLRRPEKARKVLK